MLHNGLQVDKKCTQMTLALVCLSIFSSRILNHEHMSLANSTLNNIYLPHSKIKIAMTSSTLFQCPMTNVTMQISFFLTKKLIESCWQLATMKF